MNSHQENGGGARAFGRENGGARGWSEEIAIRSIRLDCDGIGRSMEEDSNAIGGTQAVAQSDAQRFYRLWRAR